MILQLTMVFQRGIIFDPTTIPVHDPNNNNIFVDWMILFDLQFQFIVVVVTMVFQRGIIFDPTTIPVHDPNNNNNKIIQYRM